jgi:4'-phosphopantetheinyl transferase
VHRSAVLRPAELDLHRTLPPLRTPPSGSVVLWHIDASRQAEAAARLAPGLLDDNERLRASALRRTESRSCYVTAHVALRLLLGEMLSVAPAAVRFEREPCPECGGPDGRPVPVPGTVHFSLTHSRHLALMAFAATPVGIDLEAMPPPQTVAGAHALLHPREAEELTTLPSAARPRAFARAWVRREAYLKGTGAGLGHNHRPYAGIGPSPAQDHTGWSLRDVTAPAGFAAAVAVHSPVV